ncbi:MAG: hypothetical protein HY360_20000 [Verrucomicrobia bacterium]|nr:hypothetical protein [Verrucomicrobiota bacterium]
MDDLRRRLGEAGLSAFHEKDEPGWEQRRAVLQNRYELNAETSQSLIMALERLWLLPFRRYEACSPLVVFRLVHLPAYVKRFRKERDQDGLVLARAFHILVEAILQGSATFPGDPLHLAKEVETAISSPTTLSRKSVLPLARILIAGSNEDGLCGLNHFRSANPNDIALHEHKKEFNRVHKARGIERQGEKLDDNRKELDEQSRRLQKAKRRLVKGGLRGEAHSKALIQEMIPARAAALDPHGLDEHADSHLRHVRRLLGRKVR